MFAILARLKFCHVGMGHANTLAKVGNYAENFIKFGSDDEILL